MQGTAVVVPPAQNFGEALRASLAGALNIFLATVPRLLGFAVILVVGWVISSLLERAVFAYWDGAIRPLLAAEPDVLD